MRASPALAALATAAVAAVALAALAACPAPAPAPAPPRPAPPPAGTAFHATVRWTSDGVPHVTADDWGSLGFGQGWALAALHLCEVEDQVVRVRAERSRFFGPGDDDANLDSDFFHLHLGFAAHARDALAAASPEARAMGHGFVAGFDRWLAQAPASAWPAACRGAAWVRPLTDEDLAALSLAIATTASSRALAPLIARAAPRDAHAARASLPAGELLASNGWAIGADRTAHGGGLVVANPHFPWEGDLQFYEAQLTLPGQLDVYGAALIGTPGVQIGFNARVAWTHTFSSSVHFVVYRVPLDKDQPLRLALPGNPEPIVPATYAIQVLQPDGKLAEVTRTLYRTRWGPMLDSAELPWDPASGFAFTLKDVAVDDASALDEYLRLGRAASVDDVEAAIALGHTPFVNTIAADAAGDALYVDGTRVPALSDDGLAAWTLGRRALPALAAAWQKGVVVLDAAMPVFELAGDAHGAIPFERAPRLRRRDWVVNANGPYLYTHPGVAMPPASPLYGDAAEPSPRTLASWDLLAGDDKLDRAAAAARMLSNRSSTAERLRADVVARCRAATVALPPPPRRGARDHRRPPATDVMAHDPALAALCDTLERWDGRFGVDSRGAALWRETLTDLAPGGRIPWARPYAADDAATPTGLAPAASPADDPVPRAIRAAAARLTAAGLDPAAPLGQLQHTHGKDGAPVPVPGGQQLDGVASVAMWNPFNGTLLPREERGAVTSAAGLTPTGYPVDFGTSFVMAVDLTPSGPHADVLLTYGNSGDPASAHHRDQLGRLAAGALRPALFTPAQIAADQAAHPDATTEDLRYTEPPR